MNKYLNVEPTRVGELDILELDFAHDTVGFVSFLGERVDWWLPVDDLEDLESGRLGGGNLFDAASSLRTRKRVIIVFIAV